MNQSWEILITKSLVLIIPELCLSLQRSRPWCLVSRLCFINYFRWFCFIISCSLFDLISWFVSLLCRYANMSIRSIESQDSAAGVGLSQSIDTPKSLFASKRAQNRVARSNPMRREWDKLGKYVQKSNILTFKVVENQLKSPIYHPCGYDLLIDPVIRWEQPCRRLLSFGHCHVQDTSGFI